MQEKKKHQTNKNAVTYQHNWHLTFNIFFGKCLVIFFLDVDASYDLMCTAITLAECCLYMDAGILPFWLYSSQSI